MTKLRAAVFALITVCAMAVPTAAMASDYTSPSTVTVDTPTTVPAAVLGSSVTAAPTSAAKTLPFTGGDVVGLVLLGLALLVAGFLLARWYRASAAAK